MKIILAFIFFSISTFSFSQKTVLTNNPKPKLTTPEWKFVCESYAYDGFLTIQIIKTDKGGILKLSTKTSNQNLTIGDRVFVLLQDNTFVYCTDKGKRDFIDNIASTYYSLTDQELKKLANQNITDIRFKIIGKRNSFDSQTGFFTATNKPTVYDAYSKEITIIDTKNEIKKLL